jgi:RNA polymerase sigma-70 factor (ECF subfamily)
MTDSADETIVSAVQSGDIDQYGLLIARYTDKLQRYARKFLSSPDDIEDLVQEVFIKAYVNIQSFDTSLRFSPWIYRIAHNTYVNHLRQSSRFRSMTFDIDTFLPFMAAAESADDSVLQQELIAQMDTLLSKLQPKYREVVVLHYYEGLSYQEISDVLHIPISTVGVRLNRSREQLHKIYTEMYA